MLNMYSLSGRIVYLSDLVEDKKGKYVDISIETEKSIYGKLRVDYFSFRLYGKNAITASSCEIGSLINISGCIKQKEDGTDKYELLIQKVLFNFREMVNDIILVGKIIEKPKLIRLENETYCDLTLRIEFYEGENHLKAKSGFIVFKIYDDYAENTVKLANVGDLAGVYAEFVNKKEKNDISIEVNRITYIQTK